MLYGPDRVVRGLDVQGALAAARSAEGTACDLTCVCIAMLRTAGIPARPVIGLGTTNRNRNSLLIWGEFYLPEAGWIPFDAKALQSKGVRSWTTDRSWNGFGNLSGLNKQIPLAHAFTPGAVTAAYDAWSIWGWSRLVGVTTIPLNFTTGNQPSSINYSIINRGRYPE
jgi:transglutaminase-like putative cysteine protease